MRPCSIPVFPLSRHRGPFLRLPQTLLDDHPKFSRHLGISQTGEAQAIGLGSVKATEAISFSSKCLRSIPTRECSMGQTFSVFLSRALFKIVARHGTNKHVSLGPACSVSFFPLASGPKDPRFFKLKTAPEESIFSTSEGSGAEIPSR